MIKTIGFLGAMLAIFIFYASMPLWLSPKLAFPLLGIALVVLWAYRFIPSLRKKRDIWLSH